MNGPRDQFLPRTRFAQDHHGGTRFGHCFDLPEHLLQGRTLSDDLFKVVLCLDLIFHVYFFLRQFVLEFGDFLKCQRVIQGHRNLVRNVAEKLQISRSKSRLPETANAERAQKTFTACERQPTARSDSLVQEDPSSPGRKIVGRQPADKHWIVGSQSPRCRTSLGGEDMFLTGKVNSLGRVYRAYP